MGGHGSHPLGWTMLALVVVAYAHVILELAAAGLALAIAARIMTAAPWRVLIHRVTSSCDPRGRRGRHAVGAAGTGSAASANGREVDPSARKD
jgi:hypothetical protein